MIFSEYELATGRLTGRIRYCSRESYVPPAAEGKGWVIGQHDHETTRVKDGEVVSEGTQPG